MLTYRVADPRESELMVLLVDDDDTFRTGLAENLREDGHQVHDFAAPADLPPLASFEEVSVLITDYQLIGEDGLALADRFHVAHPRAPVLMITSYATDHLEAEAAERDFLVLLRKPLDYEEVLRLLAAHDRR